MKKRYNFVFHFYCVSWYCISFGFHVCFSPLNFEVHVPFGFFRVGLGEKSKYFIINQDEVDRKTFGIIGREIIFGKYYRRKL